MLTLPFGTVFLSDITETEIGLTGDFDVALYLYFPTICTSFDHDASETTFTGTVTLPNAFLYVEAFSSGSLVTTFSATDESGAFTFTVDSATFDTVASTGQAQVLATITDLLLDEWTVSTVIAGLDLDNLSLDGTTGVVGTIGGIATLLPVDNTVTLDPRDFSLTVGAVCF
jgi:hypothetical protein